MSYKHSVEFTSQPLLNLFNFEWLLITEYDQAKSTQSTETEETVSLLDYRYWHSVPVEKLGIKTIVKF